MADDLFIEMEAAQYTKTGQGACGDDVRFMTVEKENRHLVALSDGLGSGVKANVLATMTTSMAIKFLESNVPMLEAVEIIMDSLPICEVRKIGYATFSLFDFRLGGKARISEMGNPGYIHLRGTDEIAPLKPTCRWSSSASGAPSRSSSSTTMSRRPSSAGWSPSAAPTTAGPSSRPTWSAGSGSSLSDTPRVKMF